MGKFTSFVMNSGGREMTADQSAAIAAADAAVTQGRSTVAPTAPADQLGEQIIKPQPTAAPELSGRATEVTGQPIRPQALDEISPEETGEFAGAEVATQEEVEGLYQEQIAAERRPRGVVDVQEGRITLPVSPRSPDVGQLTNNIARMEHAADQDFGVVGTGKIANNAAIRAMDKLGLTEGKINPKSGAVSSSIMRPKQAFGGAAYLAMLISLSKATSPTVGEYKGEGEFESSSRGKTDNIHKISTFDRAAMELEKLVRPTPEQTVNPETGEATGVGYESSLAPSEVTALGDMIYRMASETGLINNSYSNDPGSNALMTKVKGKQEGVEEFALTEKGQKFLTGSGISNMLEQIAPGTARKVSLTPMREGRYSGESAVIQTQRTKVPEETGSQLSPMMLEAMDVMGTTPFVVVDHALQMSDDFLTDILEKETLLNEAAKKAAAETGQPFKMVKRELANQPEFQSEFAHLFDLGYARQAKLEEESARKGQFKMKVKWDAAEGKWLKGDGSPVAEFMIPELDEAYAEQKTEGDFVTEHQVQKGTRPEDSKTHAAFARSTIEMATMKAQKTIDDAKARSGQVFYYGATAIGNSGRLMVTQTELNYQNNKLARFIVGNPRASKVSIDANGEPSRAFKYVVARGMMSGADTLTPAGLVRRFDDNRKQIDGQALSLYEIMQQPPGETRRKALAGVMKDIMRNELLADEWEGTGEWGFILDAMHEWGRYLNAKRSGHKQFHTRVRAEADGINNGSSIQGLQFGDRSILERAGVVYDFDGEPVVDGEYASVIPQGNMRDFTFGILFNGNGPVPQPGKAVMADVNEDVALRDISDNMKPAIAEMLPKIYNHSAMRKKFIKIPLMTTIYGKGSRGHADSAEVFVNKYAEDLGIAYEDRKAYEDAFTNVIANSLQSALNEPLVHQSLVKKQAGWLFTVMNEVPTITGPNGFQWQAGGKDWIADPDTVSESGRSLLDTQYWPLDENLERIPQTGDKVKKGSITSKIDIASATARKATTEKAVKEERELEKQLKEAEAAGDEQRVTDLGYRLKDIRKKIQPFGEMTRNQLAVNGTHNIDSTVAQKTLIEAKKKLGDTFWGGQVFDAFIGDVGSFEAILDEGNKQFLEINRNFNIIQAEYDGMRNAFDNFEQKMREHAPDDKIDISDKGSYRGVGAFISTFGTATKAKEHIRGGHEALMNALSEAGIKVTQKTKAARPKLETKTISPAQMRGLVKFLRANFLSPKDVIVDDQGKLLSKDAQMQALGLSVDEAFKRNITRTENAKQDFLSEYRDVLGSSRQFN